VGGGISSRPENGTGYLQLADAGVGLRFSQLSNGINHGTFLNSTYLEERGVRKPEQENAGGRCRGGPSPEHAEEKDRGDGRRHPRPDVLEQQEHAELAPGEPDRQQRGDGQDDVDQDGHEKGLAAQLGQKVPDELFPLLEAFLVVVAPGVMEFGADASSSFSRSLSTKMMPLVLMPGL
jgi:hypothetical protein